MQTTAFARRATRLMRADCQAGHVKSDDARQSSLTIASDSFVLA
jgi:hypothetical protein